MLKCPFCKNHVVEDCRFIKCENCSTWFEYKPKYSNLIEWYMSLVAAAFFLLSLYFLFVSKDMRQGFISLLSSGAITTGMQLPRFFRTEIMPHLEESDVLKKKKTFIRRKRVFMWMSVSGWSLFVLGLFLSALG